MHGIHEPLVRPVIRYAKALNIHPNNYRLDAMKSALRSLIEAHAHIIYRSELLIACAGVVGQIRKYPDDIENTSNAIAWSSRWLAKQSKPNWWNIFSKRTIISPAYAEREIRDLLKTYFPEHLNDIHCT